MRYFFLFCVIACVSTPVYGVEHAAWDFESENTGFFASRDDVLLSRKTGDGAVDASSASLLVQLSSRTRANYISSGYVPIATREFYRLTAWVRVDASEEGLPVPRIFFEYATDEEDTRLGRGLVACYDVSRLGTWQKLTGEFRVPFGAAWGRVVVGDIQGISPAANPPETVIAVDDITLEQIPHYDITGKYYLDPLPASLERVRGIHPRIYLTSDRIAHLRQVIQTTHADIWQEFIAHTDKLLAKDPPQYVIDDGWSDIEQLYMRDVGNNIPKFAMAYVLSGDEKYFESAVKWARAACGYPTWGLKEFENVDLATGHQLFGLSLLYDWCYDDLDTKTRDLIRKTLFDKSSYLFDVAAKGIIVKDAEAYKKHPWPEWDEAYLQNHSWINSCGLAVAGMAIFDEVDGADRWMAFTLDRYRRTMELLGPDGASHEGPGYWTYGVEWMLKFMAPARDLLDVDMFQNEWMRSTWKYRVYMSLPQNSWTYTNTTVDVNDSPRYDWYGPDYMLRRFAGEYGNGYAQWLADAMDDADVTHQVSPWLNLLWYNPAVKSVKPDGLPTLHNFTDIGIVTARTDWSGDESFLFFRCGPYIGEKAINTFTYCPSSAHHVHPDVNNFVLFGDGEWLIREDGYRAKYTGYHNTLLIDNKGQLGGAMRIFNGVEPHALQASPTILRAESTPELDHITGDATAIYDRERGLKQFRRHLLFLKPDILIVIDDIILDGSHDLELRFHPEQQKAERDGSVFFTHGEKANLRLDPLTTDGIVLTSDMIDTLSKKENGEIIPLFTIQLMKKTNAWRNAVALTWSESGTNPAIVTLNETQDVWTFSAQGRTVEFDWATETSRVLK